jgi:putative SOS response-associated peptidase YedK
MEPIHNRMGVILDPDAAALWLDATVTDASAVIPLP